MTLIITVVHIIVSLSLVFVVLLQKGSGADMGAAFGGSSQSLFGARGSGSFLGKLTAALAAVFMLTSLSLAFFTTQKGAGVSVMDRNPVAASEDKASPATGTDEIQIPLPPKSEIPLVVTPAKTPEAGNKPVPTMPDQGDGATPKVSVPANIPDTGVKPVPGHVEGKSDKATPVKPLDGTTPEAAVKTATTAAGDAIVKSAPATVGEAAVKSVGEAAVKSAGEAAVKSAGEAAVKSVGEAAVKSATTAPVAAPVAGSKAVVGAASVASSPSATVGGGKDQPTAPEHKPSESKENSVPPASKTK